MENKSQVDIMKETGISIPLELSLFTPTEVINSLRKNQMIKKWFDFIRNYHPQRRKRILLFVPCTRIKPYARASSHKRINLVLNKFSDIIDLVVLSEPFAVVPYEFNRNIHEETGLFGKGIWYECPGLYRWFYEAVLSKLNTNDIEPWNIIHRWDSICIITDVIKNFLRNVSSYYNKFVAWIPTYTRSLVWDFDSISRQILEILTAQGFYVDIHPNRKESEYIVKNETISKDKLFVTKTGLHVLKNILSNETS